MARVRSIRNTLPSISHKASDKVMAALRYTCGEMAARGMKTSEYARAPLYYDALWRWYQALDASHEELVSDIIDAWGMPDRRKAAEQWAAHLPPAPRYPSELN
jgi:hypothetical protein